jgi:hypothetical protein
MTLPILNLNMHILSRIISNRNDIALWQQIEIFVKCSNGILLVGSPAKDSMIVSIRLHLETQCIQTMCADSPSNRSKTN